MSWHSKARFSTSTWFQFTLYSCLVLLFFCLVVAVHFSFPEPEPYILGAVDCFPYTIYLLATEAVLCVIGIIVSVIVLWNVLDNFHIKNELKIDLVLGLPLAVIWVIYRIGNVIPITISSDVIVWIIIVIFFATSVAYPLYLSYGERWTRGPSLLALRNRELTTTNSLAKFNTDDIFQRVLGTPALLDPFRLHCERSFCVENLVFFQDVNYYRQLPPPERPAKARFMHKMYIAPGSPYELNIDGKTIRELSDKIKEEAIDGTLFDQALEQVYSQMKADSFEKWRKKPEFQRLWKKHARESRG